MTYLILGSRFLASAGLVVTVVGCVLLYFFGLPADVVPSGAQYIITEDADTTEIEKGKKYARLGRLGICFVGAGSLLQLAAVWASHL